MVAQFVEDLVHFECRWNCLDEYGCPNRAAWNPKFILREIEDIIPYACLEVAFHFRQVEIRAAAALDQFLCVVKKVEAEIEQPACYGFPVDQHVFFKQMPAPRSDDQNRDKLI